MKRWYYYSFGFGVLLVMTLSVILFSGNCDNSERLPASVLEYNSIPPISKMVEQHLNHLP